MRDEDVDQHLRRAARETPVDDVRSTPIDDGLLLAYRAGTLSPEAAAAVERHLAADPEARALLNELGAEVSAAEVNAVAARVSLPTNVIPLWRRRPAAWVAVTLAAAAGVTLVVWPSGPDAVRYQLEVEGGTAATRGAAAPAMVLFDESRLTIRLRAEQATEAPRVLGAFLEGPDGTLRTLDLPVEGARGSFETQLGAAGLPLGRHRVWLFVARDAADLRAAVGSRHSDVAGTGVWWVPLDVERRAPP
jgi:hypothetical protein